jgi:AraC-like DNA-binding protein
MKQRPETAQPLPRPSWEEVLRLFDVLPDVVFFVKDEQARYVYVNETLLRRVETGGKSALLGRTAREVFPPPWGARYTEQDEAVLRTGLAIRGHLELHRYPNGQEGWCLTYKFPLRDIAGRVVGLYGFSRDLPRPDPGAFLYRAVAEALARMRERLDEPLQVGELARQVGLRPERLERACRTLFGLSPRQMLLQARMERAMELLRRTDWSIAQIALACGYGDQSAFSRRFRRIVGMSPQRFRRLSPPASG